MTTVPGAIVSMNDSSTALVLPRSCELVGIRDQLRTVIFLYSRQRTPFSKNFYQSVKHENETFTSFFSCHFVFSLYECELKGPQSLVRTWSVGPASGSPSKIPAASSLGETAVDFDFITPTLKQDIDIKDIEVQSIKFFNNPFIFKRKRGTRITLAS